MKRLLFTLLILTTATAWAEGPRNLAELAKAIQDHSPSVPVGDKINTAFGARFHNIHAVTMGLPCTNCHVGPAYAQDYLYVRKYELPPGAPGVVDRSTCLGCHKEGGVASAWYGDAATGE